MPLTPAMFLSAVYARAAKAAVTARGRVRGAGGVERPRFREPVRVVVAPPRAARDERVAVAAAPECGGVVGIRGGQRRAAGGARGGRYLLGGER
jgi:hypothetical protein